MSANIRLHQSLSVPDVWFSINRSYIQNRINFTYREVGEPTSKNSLGSN